VADPEAPEVWYCWPTETPALAFDTGHWGDEAKQPIAVTREEVEAYNELKAQLRNRTRDLLARPHLPAPARHG
jgi:hypothetical protein